MQTKYPYDSYVIQSHQTDQFLSIEDGHLEWTKNITRNTMIFSSPKKAAKYWEQCRNATNVANKPVDICWLDTKPIKAI